LQFFQAPDGVDGCADFHQRAQVARHEENGIVKTNLNSCAADKLPIIPLHPTWFRSHIAFVQQKKKLCVANADAVAVPQRSLLYGHVVDKSAVKTLQIANRKLISILLEARVPARDGNISQAKLGRALSTDDHGPIAEGKDPALQFTGDGCQPWIHD
jgi:hypothetical protein